MSTLTYADHSLVAGETAAAKPARKPLLKRIYDAFVAAQARRADREIARYVATRGPLSDELEREIMRRLAGTRRL